MPLTLSVKRARVKNVRDQALEIVVFYSGYVPWHEASRVGATCKEMSHVWQERKNRLCEPVLDVLNKLNIATKYCRTCDMIAFPAAERQCQCSPQDRDTPLAHLDPRSDPNYSHLSTYEKCKSLVLFTATCVSNYQSNFDFDNIASSDGLPPVFRFDWQTRECRFLAQHKPRRLAFMVNVLAAYSGQCNLYGEEGMFAGNQAFAGNGFGPIVDTMYYVLHRHFCEGIISDSFPLPDDTIKGAILRVNATNGKVWETLGPVLTQKLHFLAPFVSTEEGTRSSAIIPNDMEPVFPQADALALSLFE